MENLKDYIHENIVVGGYGLSYDLSKDKVERLRDLCNKYLEESVDREELINGLNQCISQMKSIINPEYGSFCWGEIYDKIFSHKVAGKFKESYKKLTGKDFEWVDPDMDYSDDVLAFYFEAKKAVEEINNDNRK